MALTISDKVSAVDMPNGITYIGQFMGKWNVNMTNYCIVSTLEIANHNGKVLDTLSEIYSSNKERGFLEKTMLKIDISDHIAWYPNIPIK